MCTNEHQEQWRRRVGDKREKKHTFIKTKWRHCVYRLDGDPVLNQKEHNYHAHAIAGR
jgi:hypothetical protein